MRRLLITVAAIGLLTTACAGESPDDETVDHPTLLQSDDLPPVESVHSGEGNSNTKTACAAMDREYNLAISGKDNSYLEYRLENGDLVKSAVQWPRMHEESINHTFAELRTMIDECLAEDSGAGAFEELTDLPDRAIGFRSTQDTSNGTQTTERGYVPVDSERAAVVTVIHVGEGEPAASVTDLLPKALERARG